MMMIMMMIDADGDDDDDDNDNDDHDGYRDEHHGDFGADITDWKEILSSKDLQLQFEEKCAEAGETEVYFLLSAFANMAMSR